MEISLHVGAHRTATTTFQRMMGQSGAVLRADGLAYWGPKRTRSDLFAGVIGRPSPLPWTRLRADRPSGRIAQASGRLAAQGVTRLLISEENMLGSLRGCVGTGRLYPNVTARAARLSDVFGGQVTRIGVAIRSYDTWWTSALAFMLARGGPLPDAALCRAIVAQRRRWRHVIEELAVAFPAAEVTVWRFEDRDIRPDTVAEALLGCDPSRLSGALDWHNAAPTPAALRQHASDLGHAPDVIREEAGRFQPFGEAARHTLQAQYAKDLAWLDAPGRSNIRYIDTWAKPPDATGRGRGHPHDGAERHMA